MKESTFYKTAFENSTFCRDQLDELRYFRKVEVGFLMLAAIGFAAHTLYAGVKDGQWDAGMAWLVIAGISSAGYSVTSSRIAALEAIQERAEPVASARARI